MQALFCLGCFSALGVLCGFLSIDRCVLRCKCGKLLQTTVADDSHMTPQLTCACLQYFPFRLGRRVILIFSGVGTCFSLLLLSLSFLLANVNSPPVLQGCDLPASARSRALRVMTSAYCPSPQQSHCFRS